MGLKMKIGLVSIPSRNNENPYQKLFYQELKKYGFEIRDGIDFRLPDIIRNRGKINVLHFHWYPAPENSILSGYFKTFFFFIKLVFVKAMRIKIVWTAHNLLPHDITYYRLQFIRRWILVHMCDAIIVHFKRAEDRLYDMFKVSKRKMIRIHHGLYESCYQNSIDIQSARASLNIPVNATVFLYFGNIRRYKNIENLIQGFHSAAAGNADIFLFLAGKPQDEMYLQELLELAASHPRILSFFGFIPDTHIQYYFNAADCCILPYENIFTSGAALLALTFRKPIIMKRCDFSDEYLTSENSLLLNDLNVDAIKKAIEDFYRRKKSFIVTDEFASRYKWENIFSDTIVNQLQGLLCTKYY